VGHSELEHMPNAADMLVDALPADARVNEFLTTGDQG
jgi:hypothetical protein